MRWFESLLLNQGSFQLWATQYRASAAAMAGISPDFDHASPLPSTEQYDRLELARESPQPADFPPLQQLARALASDMRFVRGEVDDRGLVIAAHAATQHKGHAFIDGCGDVLRISQRSLVVW